MQHSEFYSRVKDKGYRLTASPDGTNSRIYAVGLVSNCEQFEPLEDHAMRFEELIEEYARAYERNNENQR